MGSNDGFQRRRSEESDERELSSSFVFGGRCKSLPLASEKTSCLSFPAARRSSSMRNFNDEDLGLCFSILKVAVAVHRNVRVIGFD